MRNWEVKNKQILVLGLGVSGLAAARVLVSRGAKVSVYDEKPWPELKKKAEGLPASINLLTRAELDLREGRYDLAVVSPGISLEHEVVQEILTENIPLIGEVELAYRLSPPSLDFIAVTGTNGKTTTTALAAEILRLAGIKTMAAGNIGLALVEAVEKLKRGVIVTEISSFQLETVVFFHPVVSGITNVTPDHLDRHHTVSEYVKTKSRIFMNQQPHEFTVLNREDPILQGLKPPCRVLYFSRLGGPKQGVGVEEGKIVVRIDNREDFICRTEEIRMRGSHNLENALLAVGMAKAYGVDKGPIREALLTFAGVRHRLEEVAVIEGVLYVNDSKGTNPDSTIKAIESFDNPLVLIAGGRNKGADFSLLAQKIKEKVKKLVLLGEAKSIIREAVEKEGFSEIVEVRDLEEAVAKAKELAVPGDVVLLSPACASWDMFRNFEERGELFCRLVRSLGEEG